MHNITTLWVGILGDMPLITEWSVCFGGGDWRLLWCVSLNNVRFASRLKWRGFILLVFYNPFLFLRGLAGFEVWLHWRVAQTIGFWHYSSGCGYIFKICILFSSSTLSMLQKWLGFSWIMWLSCMSHLDLWFLTEIRYALAVFGRLFSPHSTPNWI